MPSRSSSVPWPPFFQQWNTVLPRSEQPGQLNAVSGVMTPASSAAIATTGLKVEPGAISAADRLVAERIERIFDQRLPLRRRQAGGEGAGIKPGDEAIASTSPVQLSINQVAAAHCGQRFGFPRRAWPQVCQRFRPPACSLSSAVTGLPASKASSRKRQAMARGDTGSYPVRSSRTGPDLTKLSGSSLRPMNSRPAGFAAEVVRPRASTSHPRGRLRGRAFPGGSRGQPRPAPSGSGGLWAGDSNFGQAIWSVDPQWSPGSARARGNAGQSWQGWACSSRLARSSSAVAS